MTIVGKAPVKKEDFLNRKLIGKDVYGFRINPETKEIFAYVGDDAKGNPIEIKITKSQYQKLK